MAEGQPVGLVQSDHVQRGPSFGVPEALACLAFVVLVQVLGALALAVLGRKLFKHQELAFGIASYQFLVLGAILAVLWLVRFRSQSTLRELGFHFPGWQAFITAGTAVLPVFLGVVLLEFAFNALFPGYLRGNAKEILQGAPKHPNIALQALVLLWAAVEAPLTEETLFRGILYQGLRRTLVNRLAGGWAIAVAALISGVIFGLVHFQPHTLPILAFLGLALALIFQVTRSVYSSAFVHGIVNFVAVVGVFHTQ